jgi:CheY-like chemotaxis protein
MIDRRSVKCLKCLVVDDDHDGAEIVGEFLNTLGAEVRVVYGGQAAIDIAPTFRPRMVVLDINMPSIDGLETCRRLKQQRWADDAVFIAYTAMDLSRAAAAAAGFDRVVSKGDAPDVFEKVLNGLADESNH